MFSQIHFIVTRGNKDLPNINTTTFLHGTNLATAFFSTNEATVQNYIRMGPKMHGKSLNSANNSYDIQ